MNDEQIERVAKALCAETCAYAGEPPCYSVEGDWPNPECDEPGCHTLAARAIAAMQPDAQAIRNEASFYVCPDDATALNYLESAYGHDFRCAVSCMMDVVRTMIKENTDD